MTVHEDCAVHTTHSEHYISDNIELSVEHVILSGTFKVSVLQGKYMLKEFSDKK